MLRSLLAVLLGAVLMYVWGFTFWMFTPLPEHIMKPLPNDSAIIEALKSQNLAHGAYHSPMPSEMTESAFAEFTKKHEAGPILIIQYQPQGSTPMGPATLGMGFGHMVFSSAGMAFLLWLVGGSLPSFVARWFFVACVSILSVVNIYPANAIWFIDTWTYTGIMSFFDVVGWVLAGIPLAALVKPRST